MVFLGVPRSEVLSAGAVHATTNIVSRAGGMNGYQDRLMRLPGYVDTQSRLAHMVADDPPPTSA
jgi:hypothetical protein